MVPGSLNQTYYTPPVTPLSHQGFPDQSKNRETDNLGRHLSNSRHGTRQLSGAATSFISQQPRDLRPPEQNSFVSPTHNQHTVQYGSSHPLSPFTPIQHYVQRMQPAQPPPFYPYHHNDNNLARDRSRNYGFQRPLLPPPFGHAHPPSRG